MVTASPGPWKGELAGRWSSTESAHPAQTSIDGTGFNCGAIEQVSNYWSYFCGSLPVSSSVDLSPGLPDSTNEVTQVSLSIAWSGPAMTFESDTSYYRGTSDIYRDFDSTSAGETFGVCTVSVTCPSAQRPPLPVTRLAQANSVSRQSPETEEWTQEFRLHGTAGDQLDWLVGVTGFLTSEFSSAKFGFDRGDLLPNEALTVLLPLTPQLAGPVARGSRALVDDPNREQVLQSKTEADRRTLAVFGALSYRPTDRLGLRAELRTTWERLELDSIVANFAPSFGTAVPAQDFTDTTPRFSIDFTPDANSLLYVSAAKGSRSGGINAIPGLSPQEQTFDPEYNWTYELSGRYPRCATAMDRQHYALPHRLARHADHRILEHPGHRQSHHAQHGGSHDERRGDDVRGATSSAAERPGCLFVHGPRIRLRQRRPRIEPVLRIEGRATARRRSVRWARRATETRRREHTFRTSTATCRNARHRPSGRWGYAARRRRLPTGGTPRADSI